MSISIKTPIRGALTALVTPFTEDGAIDYDGLNKNLEFQFLQRIAGLVPAGTTGEASTLKTDEHEQLLAFVARRAGRAAFLMAGCGSNSTDEAMGLVSASYRLGYPSALLVDPYYNCPSSLEIAQNYYRPIAEAFPGMTIVPYVIPGRTGCELTVEDLVRLAKAIPNVRAVKDATGNRERMEKTRLTAPEGFAIFSGDDNMTFDVMRNQTIHADGVISVISNVCPGAVSKMCKAALDGDMGTAMQLHNALTPLFNVVTVLADRPADPSNGEVAGVQDKFRNPVPVKTLMAALGMPVGPCRRPLGKMTKPGVMQIRDAISVVLAKSPELFRPIEDFYGVDIARRWEDDAMWEALTYWQ